MMSKISGINLGNPSDSFQVYGSQLGGRDESITVRVPTANINRAQIDKLAKELNAHIKEINGLLQSLQVMEDMMVMDEDTDSIILDKQFADDYSKKVSLLKSKFEELVIAANSK